MDEEFYYYNKHYLTTREDGAIIDGWSDGPHPEKSTDGAILLSSTAGYQFRLILDGKETEENPSLWTMEGIPLYKWDGSAVQRRTPEEIQAEVDQIPPPPPSLTEQMAADIQYIAIMTGVELY